MQRRAEQLIERLATQNVKQKAARLPSLTSASGRAAMLRRTSPQLMLVGESTEAGSIRLMST